MGDKIEITFDPLRRDKLVGTKEAMKELHKFYEDLKEAGFKSSEAMELLVTIMMRQGK